jgi:hypothetical protein
MSEDEFDEQYTTLKNPFDNEVGWEGCFLETYWEELEFVRKQKSDCIWTMIDCEDGGLWLVSGYCLVNRVNYLITEEPTPENVFIEVKLD